MSIVVLMGWRTACKASTSSRIQTRHPGRFLHIDSDADVSSEFGGWLENIYVTHASNTSEAESYIDFRERYVLTKLLLVKEPCLLTAGPLLPTREPSWSVFVNCAKPVCFYLEETTEEIYVGLKARREWQRQSGLDHQPGFGSWDEGLLTKYNADSGKWDELPREDALIQIEQASARLRPAYEKFSIRTFSASKLEGSIEWQNYFDHLVAHYLQMQAPEYYGVQTGVLTAR